MWAEEVTFAFGDYKEKGTQSTGSEYKMEKGDITITNTKFYGNDSYAHFYANGVTTITPASGVTVTKIVLTANGTGYNGYQSNGQVTTSTGSISGSTTSTTVTWTGTATEAFTISNTKQIRWTSIVVTYSKSGGGDTPIPTTFTVTYDCNGGTSGCPENITDITAGTSITLADAPTKTDYTFNGWNDGNTTYEAGASYTVNEDVTMTAQWTENSSGTGENVQWVLTSLAELTSSDVFVIVGNNGSNYAMSNDNGTGSAPKAVAVAIENDAITGEIADNIQWTISGNATDGYTFYPKGSTATWLYCTNSNNGVRVGTEENKIFNIKTDYLFNTATSRYVGIYISQDWRCYTSININSNITGQTFAFYKKVTGGVNSPSISANNVEIPYDAREGRIAYTLNNEPNPAGTLTASVSEGSWITLGTIGETITFTCEANETTTARTAIVTLTYTYGDNQTVTKDVTVTQAAGILVYKTIPNLFDAATSNETNVNVSFGNWVVSGVTSDKKTAYVTDNSGNGFIIYTSNNGFEVNDELSGTVNETPLKLFKGAAEFTNLTASTSGLTVSKDGEITIITDKTIADLGGVNTGAVISLSNLTYDGTNLSDGTNTIQPYTTLYSGTFVSGKTYNVTGVYLQFGNTKEILPRSADDIVEVVSAEPVIEASDVILDYDATTGVIEFNIVNDVPGVALTAETDAEWISNINVSSNTITFTTTANEGNADRTANITLKYTGATDKVVTVTQKFYVIDYAELPFSWKGGSSSAFLALNGVTANGLGSSDYTVHAPYAIKLDSDGDYIQIKTNGQPDVVTIGVKMVGGSNDSFITVQGSADGITFKKVEVLTISGAQNSISELETTNAFEVTDRYVRLYFTKGSNVGVGPISITAVGQPSISVKTISVDALAEGEDGTFEVNSKNVSDLDFAWYTDETAATTTTQPEWITISFSPTGSGDVDYSISANEGEARSAFMKIHGKDNVGNDIYSELVTITQAEYVIDYAELPFAWDDNTTPTGVRNSGVSTYGNSPYMKFDTTGDYIILKVNEAPEWLSFDIKGNTFSGGTFTVQTSADGRTYTDLATYTELGDTQSESFSDLGNIRYIKWIYTEKSAGNVALGNILVTKTKSVSVTSAGLATYCSTEALDFSNVEGLTAYKATLSGTELSFEKVTTVPAGTGVLLKGNEGTYQIPVIASAKTIENNVLVGVTESTGKSAGIFVLMNGDKGVGFYKTTKAFTVGANTAYIDDSSLPANVRFIGFDGETTGITTMTEMKTNGSIYNLNGQRVTTPKKGLYIMNGKKVVNK